MAFAFSPSNMMTFKACPRKFWGQSISKLIKWTPSKQKSRGTFLHEAIQDSLRDFSKLAEVRKDTQIDMGFTEQCVSYVHRQLMGDYTLCIEHEMAMTKDGKKTGWFDDNCFLRAKADAILLPPLDKYPTLPVVVIDIKTGKNYGDTLQLRTEALLAHILYGRSHVRWEYWYVDQGESVTQLIDFGFGLTLVQDVYDTIKEMSLAMRNNDFPCTPNRFCRWCDFNKTDNCDVR